MSIYKQFSRYDRKIIEEGLDEGLSFRVIAKMLERSASSVSREVQVNRSPLKGTGKMRKCAEKAFCKICSLCDVCPFGKRLCMHCTEYDCRTLCETYITRTACPTLSKGRHVCNGCKKRTWGCCCE
jgi:hypothetical protein